MRQMLIFIVALGLLSSSSVAQFRLPDSPPLTPKLIKAGRILDVTSGKYILNQGILTEDERIKEVGPWEQVQSHAPKGVITIDLGQATVLPGLADCHSHLLVSMPPQMSGGESLTTAVALMSPSFGPCSELSMQRSIWKLASLPFVWWDIPVSKVISRCVTR